MRKFKGIISLILVFLMSGNICFNSALAFTPSKSSINSKAVYMVNLDTGTVVYKQNEHKVMYPASFTKIMTAIMVLEKYPDPKKITVTAPGYIFDELYGIGASNAGIMRGEKVRLIDLLYAMILPSACEAASIIADFMGNGSIPDFCEAMTARAKELGAKNTNFVNAHGLFDPDQVTTAYDMYLIVKHALTFPLFEKIATTREYKMPATNKHSEPRYIYHTNTMMSSGGMYYYPYIKGIKTGTTDESGKNLVSMASKDGYSYLLITMGAPVKHEDGTPILDNLCYIDTKNLYEWAFENFSVKTVVEKTNTVADIKVKLSWDTDHLLLSPEKDVAALLPADADPSSVQQIVDVPEYVNAPIKAGQKIGKMTLRLAGEVIGEVDLVASKNVQASAVLSALDWVKQIVSSLAFKIIIAVLLLLIVLYAVFIVLYNKKLKKNRGRRGKSVFSRKTKMKRRRPRR